MGVRWKPVKERDRGLSGGEFALAMAAVQLTGEDHLVGFDRVRADVVGEGLLPAPVPPSTTAATLAARFDQPRREGIERASAQVTGRALAALPVGERARILAGRVTIDLDANDIEMYSLGKEQVIRSYKGEIAGLTDDQAEAYGKFTKEPTRPELERFFFLDDVDRDLIALRRRQHHQLGFALQMCTVRYVGLFLGEDPLDVPWPVVEHLAGQLGIEDASCVKRYTDRRQTVYDHAWEIREAYGYRLFEDHDQGRKFRAFLHGRAWTHAELLGHPLRHGVTRRNLTTPHQTPVESAWSAVPAWTTGVGALKPVSRISGDTDQSLHSR